MFIVKDAVQAKRRYDLNPDCEMIWLELYLESAKIEGFLIMMRIL